MLLDLAHLIKTTRTDRGLSQGGLADRLDVSRQAVKKWEDGDVGGMKLLNLMRLCEVLDLSANHIMAIARAETSGPTFVLHEPSTARDEYRSAAAGKALSSRPVPFPTETIRQFEDLTEEGQALAATQLEIGIETARRLHGTRSKQTAA